MEEVLYRLLGAARATEEPACGRRVEDVQKEWILRWKKWMGKQRPHVGDDMGVLLYHCIGWPYHCCC